MPEQWVEKYQPRRLSDVVGQPKAVQDITVWANGWKRGRPSKPAILLYGPAGTGKSAAAAAIAREFGWDFVEMNASDKRTLAEIKRVAGAAATAGTLLAGAGGRRLVVLDEADNIHGTADRGGYRALQELVHETQNPLVLIANDQYDIPWEIRAACVMVNFRRLADDVIVKELQRICQAEGVTAEPQALNVIAETARGDMRSAINDLQTLTLGKKRMVVKDLLLYRRDRKTDVYDFLTRLLSVDKAKDARTLLWGLDLPPDDALAWIAENVPRIVVDPADRVNVYDAISRADIFLGRARRGQAYGLWGYASDLMSAGVGLSRGEKLKWSKLESPSHIKRFARTRVDRAVRDAVAIKIAKRCHTSARVARRDVMRYLGTIFKRDKEAAKSIATELELTDAESNFLKALG